MVRSKKIILALTLSSSALMIGFQNCSKVGFEVTPEVLKADRDALENNSSVLLDKGADYTNQKTVQVSFVSPRAAEMKLSLKDDCSDGVWVPYVSEKLQAVTTPNAKLEVFAQFKDFRGDITACKSDAIIHDDKAPVAAFTTADDIFTNVQNLKIAWTAQDNLSGIDKVVCHDNAGAEVVCTASMTVANEKEGANSVKVQVIDKAGNKTPDLFFGWVFDKTPPTIALNTKPADISGSAVATLGFEGSDSISGIQSYSCSLDSAPAATCVSPLSLNGLSEGLHKFEVTAVDRAGNKSVAAVANWKVDMTAPDLRFTQTPSAITNIATGTFSFTATDDGTVITNLQCSLDNAAFTACTSPKATARLTDGSHSFQVRAFDTAGNLSSPIKYSWVIDTVAPAIAFTSNPSLISNVAEPLFQWAASDAGGLKDVECLLDSTSLGSCLTSAFTLPVLADGAHTFEVRASDFGGNKKSAIYNWTVDLIAPVVTIASGPDQITSAVVANFAFSATDSASLNGFECKLDLGNYASCVSPNQLKNVIEGTHIFYVRATDKAGNVSLPVTYSWTVDIAPPLIRIISAPATLLQGGVAEVKYEVADVSSGLASVQCGLTSPSNTIADCPAVATANLGALNVAGAYTFELRAVDKVGNSSKEIITIQVTNRPVVCDPFDKTAEGLCNGGFLGEIYYLTSAQRTAFKALSKKTVDFFYSNGGTKIDAILNLKTINVSTRQFSAGFPTQSGAPLVDNSGKVLDEYFAFRLNTVVKIDPAIDQPGWYQFATISDDGSAINYKTEVGAATTPLVDNDGDHSPKMGCSAKAIYISDTSRLPMQLKYYQGPATEIALVLVWRRVASETAPLDSLCGHTSSSDWFGPGPVYGNITTSYNFGKLVDQTDASHAWKVMSSGNFIAPASFSSF